MPRSLSLAQNNQDPIDANVPKSLYLFSGNQPSLADLRNALRKNIFSHHEYNPELELKRFKAVYNAGNAMDISKHHNYNEAFE